MKRSAPSSMRPHSFAVSKDAPTEGFLEHAVLGGVADGVTAQDASGRLVYVNEAAARMSGYASPEEMLADQAANILERFELLDSAGNPLPPAELPGRLALQGQESAERIIRFRDKRTGEERVSRVRAKPVRDEDGRVKFAVNIFHNITREFRAQAARRLLVEAGTLLTSAATNGEETLRTLAKLVVPQLADWCVIDLRREKGMERVAVANADPAKVAFAEELRVKYPPRPDESGAAEVINTGKSQIHREITPEMIENSPYGPEYARIIRDLGLCSALIVPLAARGKTLGALTLVHADSGRRFDDGDLQVAEELGRLAGLAMDNAQLYEASREAVENLSQAQQIANLGSWKWNVAKGEVRLSDHLREMLEWGEQEAIPAPDRIWDLIPAEDATRIKDLFPAASAKGAFRVELKVRCGGKFKWMLCQGKILLDEKGQPEQVWGTALDITRLKESEERVRYQAYHDSLTGLPNRTLLEERVEQAILQVDENGGQCAVLFLDLDRFKTINDTLGHRMGDTLLKEVAERLQYCTLRKGDTIARISGDKFVMLLNQIESAREAVRVAKKVLILLEPAIKAEGHSFHISASLGIALYPNDGKDVHTILKNADLALYRAKEYGRNRYQMYDETMNQQATKRFGLENDLRGAIKNHELRLYYQPIVDLKNNRVMEMEALIRWQHPKFGLLLPGDFIPMAEETGLIVLMGQWLFRRGFEQFREWQKIGLDVPRLAINLSPLQFSDTQLMEKISGTLSEFGLDPGCLDIEITESTAMENIDRTAHKLRALRAMGAHITIDDFGTGYSSLNYLKRFPLDKLKIDKSFVKHAVFEEQDATIIKTIISIGHTLNLKVVAEGVETARQVTLLSKMGCDKVQGYFLSPPMPFEEATAWLRLRQNNLFAADPV